MSISIHCNEEAGKTRHANVGCNPLVMAIVLLAGALCAGSARGVTITSAQSGYWTNTNTWNPAQVPTINDDVIITNGCTVTNNDLNTHDVANLTIASNGVLTHAANDSTEAYKMILQIATNLTIDAGGKIDVDGMGYSQGNGPGKPPSEAGASYGGKGGTSVAANPPGRTYGSITAPTNLGSGGIAGGWNTSGGGAILLMVNGTTTVDGVISANGRTSGSINYGGSGGSVFLRTGRFTGSGTIRANGGTVDYPQGGGGRIAVILTNDTDFGSVTMTAYSGTGTDKGAGGTIYLEHTGHTPDQGKLIVNWNDNVPAFPMVSRTVQNEINPSSYAFSEILLTNGAVYMLDTNDILDITSTMIYGDPADRNEGIYVNGGTLTVPAALAWTNYFIGIYSNSTFNPTTSVTVGTNATLKIDAAHTLNCPVTLEAGGWLSHSTNYSAEAYKLNLTIKGNLNIRTGAQVTADAAGYIGGSGPGKPPGVGEAGAAHGGIGGGTTAGNIPGNFTYGSITAPTNLGSGGGLGINGSAGGGAIRLDVEGTTILESFISADAGDNHYPGAGGSVFLRTGILTGAGTIRATGGTGPSGYTGGGGRIAVILTNATDFGTISINAYSRNNTYKGGAGTVYLQVMGQGTGEGTLLVDAMNLVPGASDYLSTTLIRTNITDTVVGTVIITNAAILEIGPNQTLTINRDWINTGGTNLAFIANTNSTVLFASTNPATVAGSNMFYNLTCTNAGKTVYFAAGSTNRVNGQLTLGGGATFKSTVDGNWWYLTLATGATQLVRGVKVQDSNAGGGQTIVVIPGSGAVNRGHNVNWSFPSAGAIFVVR